MNNQLIKKIITSNNLRCPYFAFENPLLDQNVVEALSKSFVKILKLSQQNSNVNNNMRQTILELIRKMCQIAPEHHFKVDENITTLLIEFYEQKIKAMGNTNIFDTTNKDLDAFLIREFKEMNITSNYELSLNPEIIQALNILDINRVTHDQLMNDLVHWHGADGRIAQILKRLWESGQVMPDDVYIKLKPELETILLEACNCILSHVELDIQEIFVSNASLNDIIIKSANSRCCYQICCSILHYVFVMTNFNPRIQMFVEMFVAKVKQNCPLISFSVMYDYHVQTAALCLDIGLDELPNSVKNSYYNMTIKYLSELHEKSETDLIMILSHFPHWLPVYFEAKNKQ